MTDISLPPDEPAKSPASGSNKTDTFTSATSAAWIDPASVSGTGAGRVMLNVGAGLGVAHNGANVQQGASPFVLNLLEALAANDNTIWVGSENGTDGAFGTYATAATLEDRGTIVAWIGEDRIIHAEFVPFEDPDVITIEKDARNLQDSLANLGSAGLPHGSDHGRLAVVATARNTFTALWVADFGATAALMGKAFTFADPHAYTETADASNGAGGHPVLVQSLPPVRIAGHIERFEAVRSDDGALTVIADVSGADSEPVTLTFTVVSNDGETPLILAMDGQEFSDAPPLALDVLASRSDQALVSEEAEVNELPASDPEEAQTFGEAPSSTSGPLSGEPSSLANAGAVAEAGPESAWTYVDGTGGSVSSVIRLRDSVEAKLESAPSHTPGTVKLTVTISDGGGSPSTPPTTVVIADNALVQDAERPDLDVAPILTGNTEDIAVLWVGLEENTSDSAPLRTLQVTVVHPLGDEASDQGPSVETITLAETTEALSDLDLTGRGRDGDGAEWAAAWIQNADLEGYGTLNLKQLHFDYQGDRHHAQSDGGTVAAFAQELDAPLDASEAVADVIPDEQSAARSEPLRLSTHAEIECRLRPQIDENARSPDVEIGPRDSLAIAWVGRGTEKNDGATIHGLLLTNDLKTAYRFDVEDELTGDIDVRSGPDITVIGPDAFVVGWLRDRNGDDKSGHEYEAVGFSVRFDVTSGWSTASTVVTLATFDDKPKALDFKTIEGEGELQLVLTWLDDGDKNERVVDINAFNADSTVSGSGDARSSAEEQSIALVETTGFGVLLAVESNAASDNSGKGRGGATDESETTFVAGFVDEDADVIVFGEVDAASITVLSTYSNGPTAGDVQNAISTLTRPQEPAPNFAGGDTAWPETHSINDIIDALGDQVLFSGAGLSIDTRDITAQNDNGVDVGSFDDVGSVFDALQFANVLNASANADVITFDATGYATLKEFDPF